MSPSISEATEKRPFASIVAVNRGSITLPANDDSSKIPTIVSPGTAAFPLPDLPSYGPKFGLLHGSIRSYVYAARIAGFSYPKLRYGQLGSQTWDAYAIDAKNGAY